MAELEPTADDVLQEEPDDQKYIPVCIPVTVEGPTRTVELPAKSSGVGVLEVAVGEAVRIPGDPMRKNLTLIGLDNSFRLAPNKAQAINAASGGEIPPLLRLPLAAANDWWLSSAHATDPARVTFVAEQWAQ